MLDSQFALLSETARRRVGDYLAPVVTAKPDPLETALFFLSLGPDALRPPRMARWRGYLERRARPDAPVFGPWHDLLASRRRSCPSGRRGMLKCWKGRHSPAQGPAWPATPTPRTTPSCSDLLVRVFGESKAGGAGIDGRRRQLLEVLTGHDSPAYFPKSQTRRSGRLEARLGGRPVDVAGDPRNRRRTVYGLVDRQNLPGLFRAFDFASPDQSAERRPQTTVPQQALFGMNAPFVIEQAKALAARPEVVGENDPARRLAQMTTSTTVPRRPRSERRGGPR